MQKSTTAKKSGAARAVAALKILSSHTRFNILRTLMQAKDDICVNEIAHEVGMSQSATSHQLAKLEDRGIVSSVRHGQIVCYHLTDAPITKKLKTVIKEFDV